MSNRPAARGFTLIEVMMTVAIMALILAMVGGILISVIETSETIETKLRTEKAGYGILSTLRRDLTGVYAYALGGAFMRGEDKTSSNNDADEIHFVTTAKVLGTSEGPPPKLVEVGYRIESEDDVLVLYRRAVPLEGDPLKSADEYAEIYRGIKAFSLEYMDPVSKDWKESWENKKDLPLAVKVKLELSLDEAQRRAVAAGDVEIPAPKFEMVVGIPARAMIAKPTAEEGEGQPPPPN